MAHFQQKNFACTWLAKLELSAQKIKNNLSKSKLLARLDGRRVISTKLMRQKIVNREMIRMFCLPWEVCQWVGRGWLRDLHSQPRYCPTSITGHQFFVCAFSRDLPKPCFGTQARFRSYKQNQAFSKFKPEASQPRPRLTHNPNK